MKKVLITGITGFVGSHFAEFLLSEGVEVHGLIRPRSDISNIREIISFLKLHDCTVLDSVSVMQTIKEIQPDVISHLAAQSFVPMSWKSPQDTMQTNVIGTINILEAVKEYCKDCVVHICGSSEEYGQVYEDEIPIKETNPLRPLSPYGVSKVAQDLLAQQYYRSYGLKTIITRAFNHEGPRRGKHFVTSQFIRSLLEAERKGIKKIFVGNLKSVRDFSDVRDVVNAYWLVIEHGNFGDVYNICSGVGMSMDDLLVMLGDVMGIDVKIYEKIIDFTKVRPSDVSILVGDCSKIKNLGWNHTINLDKTLKDMVEYWKKVGSY